MPRPFGRHADRGATGLLVLTASVALAGVVLSVIAWGDMAPQDAYPNLASAPAGVLYAFLGALIVRRAHNVVGWILQGVGLGLATVSFGSAYGIVGIATHPGALPAPAAIGALAEWSFAPTSIALGLMLFLFPTGSLPSPRWRTIFELGLVAGVLSTIGFVVLPRPIPLAAPGGVSLRYPNPVGIESWGHVISSALVATVLVVCVGVAAGFWAIVVRFRRGRPELRQQIKWVAFAATLAASLVAAGFLTLTACGCDRSTIAQVLLTLAAAVILLGLPAAITLAILKYRLYQIDVIINRAVVYGLLAAVFSAVYVGIVVGVGALVGRRGGTSLTLAAAVAIALLFQPLRRRAQLLANRLVYGERATPYQVLSDFAEDMAGTLALDDVLVRMASVLADGTGATRVDVWLRVGDELRPAAVWPPESATNGVLPLSAGEELPPFGESTHVVAVRHGDELLGALALEKPRNEALTVTESKLLQDLASQAGLVLRNSRLTAELQVSIEELRASRRRLVEAQDEERRKIERNLHDGAQQQLVALKVQLGLLERFAGDPAQVRRLAAALQEAAGDALDDLRDLARGIYPPLLADQGLAVALEAQGRRSPVTIRVEPDGIGRYPREIEAVVYFCTLEAMQNVAKYAEATVATVRLVEADGRLVFEIQDDGRGFDAGGTKRGTGLQGMADRLDAIGGSLEIRSSPGQGTLVRGLIKLP